MNTPDTIQNAPEVQNPEIRDGITDRLKKHNWEDISQDPICSTGGMALRKGNQYLRIRPNNGSPSGWDIEIIPPNLADRTRDALKSVLSLGRNKKENPINILQEEDGFILTRQYPRGKKHSVETYFIDSSQVYGKLAA